MNLACFVFGCWICVLGDLVRLVLRRFDFAVYFSLDLELGLSFSLCCLLLRECIVGCLF